MAQTGLRMMPTFPSPSLKFRTAGFPQYGFKASMSSTTFRRTFVVKPTPGVPTAVSRLSSPFARIRGGIECRAQSPDGPTPQRAAVRGALPLCPRGPWLRTEFCCLSPSSLTTTPSVSPAGTRRFHGRAAYTSRLRCAGAPRRPAGPSLLSLLHCPVVPLTIHRWVRGAVPLRVRPSIPGFLAFIPSRHPQEPASASNTRRGVLFRCGIIRVMLRPGCLPRPPDWLQRDAVTCAAPRLLRTLSPPLLSASVAGRRWGSG
jgi:hypothetical protein